MRYLVGFVLLLLALGTLRIVGCGDGYESPVYPACRRYIYDCNDNNHCTDDKCRFDTETDSLGTCEHQTATDDGYCDPDSVQLCYDSVYATCYLGDGTPDNPLGVCLNEVCQDNPCEDSTCGRWVPRVSDDGTCALMGKGADDGTPCVIEGVTGVCIAYSCQEDNPCEGVICDDGNLCTSDSCDYRNGGECIFDFKCHSYECQISSCDSSVGTCSYTNLRDWTYCDDNYVDVVICLREHGYCLGGECVCSAYKVQP